MTPFAALHRAGSPFLLPNAWDVASALLLADAGHPAVGTTSLGVTAAAGLLDGGGEAISRTIALAELLQGRLRVPLTLDLEGGPDDPGEAAELAVRVAELGVAGVNLEDGLAPGMLRDATRHARLIAAWKAAAPDLFVNARTDVHWLAVGDPDTRSAAATGRLQAYADAGADGIFAPGIPTADIAALTASVDRPLNVLWQPGIDLAVVGVLGVARVSTGSALYRQAMGAALATVAGTTAQPVGYDALQQLLNRDGRS